MNDSTQSFWLRRMLTEHPGLFVSGIYFIASLIGLVYSWAFLGAFGINVSRYAELSDFLLASLKTTLHMVVNLASSSSDSNRQCYECPCTTAKTRPSARMVR